MDFNIERFPKISKELVDYYFSTLEPFIYEKTKSPLNNTYTGNIIRLDANFWYIGE